MPCFIPPHDRIFQIEVTTQCNLKCAGCHRTAENKLGLWTNRHIEVEAFRAAITHARPARSIILQGIGEPTLHPHLPELIQIAADSGKFETIAFYTNGLARGIEYYDTLKANGLNFLTVSIDSLNQKVADECRFGTDVQKLLKRFIELFYTFAPNINVSLVLSRKNLTDCFETFRILNEIAKTGKEPLPVFIQKMIETSAEMRESFLLRQEDIVQFRALMREKRGLYPFLNLGPCGELAEAPPQSEATSPATKTAPTSRLCDRLYHDRFVTVEGEMTPCCVITDRREWAHTKLDAPLEPLLQRCPAIVKWFEDYEKNGHPSCAGCGLFAPLQ